jgi:hypothetical protein
MKASQKIVEPPQFLSGWKDIASYLGKGVRTVQRYERCLGLPVRRPAGKPRGSVVATKAEIDAWVAASPIREAFRLTRTVADFPASTAAAIKDGLEKMGRLRDQMMALRAEVKTSVLLLRESVHGLQGELNANRWRESAASPILERSARSKRMFDLLTTDTTERKAN